MSGDYIILVFAERTLFVLSLNFCNFLKCNSNIVSSCCHVDT